MALIPVPHSTPRSPARRRRVLLVFGGLVGGFLAAELVLRFALGQDPASLRAEMTQVVSAISERVPDRYRADAPAPGDEHIDRIIPHPFTAWDDQSSLQRVERDLAREAELRADPALAAKNFRVLVTGGSVALLYRRRGAKAMAEELERSGVLGGREVEFLHYARAAFKQPQQVAQLAWLLSMGVRPDLVLNIDGYNEVAIGQKNSTTKAHPLYPAVRFYSHVVGQGMTDPEGLDGLTAVWSLQRRAQAVLAEAASGPAASSAVFGALRLRELRRIRAEWVAAQERHAEYLARADGAAPARGPAFEGDLDAVLELLVGGWSESSRSMHALCAARGIPYLHVLQPTLADPEAGKPLSDFEVGQVESYRAAAVNQAFEAVQQGYGRLRVEGERLAAAGVPFLDATRAFEGIDETLYTDFVHFDRVGNERLAAVIAERLVALLSE